MTPPVSINNTIDIETPNTATLSGAVADPSKIVGVEIFNGSDDQGPATLNSDGTWTFDAFIGSSGQFTAVATDNGGVKQTSDALLVLHNSPQPGEITTVSGINKSEEGGFVYSDHGRTLYSIDVMLGDKTITEHLHGQGGRSIAYPSPFPSLSGQTREIIDNFRVSGPRHDTLDLSNSTFQTLADVLQNTTTSGGSTTIHIDAHTSLTLDNVTKQQIAASHHDFVFASPTPAS